MSPIKWDALREREDGRMIAPRNTYPAPPDLRDYTLRDVHIVLLGHADTEKRRCDVASRSFGWREIGHEWLGCMSLGCLPHRRSDNFRGARVNMRVPRKPKIQAEPLLCEPFRRSRYASSIASSPVVMTRLIHAETLQERGHHTAAP